MSDQFLGEVRIFAGNFAPSGWALCDGALLPISQNTALFSLLGTMYGGNGQSTFALPDLRDRVPVQPGQGPGLTPWTQGETAGATTVTLLSSEMPAHTHTVNAADTRGDTNSPSQAIWATGGVGRIVDLAYGTTAGTQLSPATMSVTGGGLPHDNRQPYLTLTFIIAMQGIFPQRP